jgi:uncharacterized BrkB/YihY/UPF0761 family membrane protein
LSGLLYPGVALGAILSTSFAALFHLSKRGKGPTLWTFLFAAWLGFALGHFAGQILGIYLLRIGQLNVMAGAVGAIIAMLVANTVEA